MPSRLGLEGIDSTAEPNAASREVLVMLRLPPLHFRPDAGYVGGYATQSGSADRKRVAEELAARFKLRIVGSWPMPALGVDCFVMEVPEALPLEPLIERLALDARVESVQAMNHFRVLAHDDPLYPLQPTAGLWHLAELHRVATGRNVRVAAIDSGVELDHPDLDGRVMLARNFVDTRDAVAELHGTAVAGIIGARADNSVGIVGVAPDARLMALRACWQAPGEGQRRRVQQLHPGEGASVRDRQPRQGDQPEPRRSARPASGAPAGARRIARHP